MVKIFDWDKIETKNRHSGTMKTTCPECSHTRKNKKDPCLYVNFTSGVAKCFHCESLSFRDSESKIDEVKEYTLPSQTWTNYTNLSENLVKWVEDERRIKQFALKDLGITEEKYYQPKKQKEVNNIVFNYFEGDKLVNKKYRTADKCFTQSTGGKPIFYNINSIIGETECYIVEGEFDVLALHSYGIKNVISVPNGANDNDDYWKNSDIYIKDIEKFIIAVDNDTKGNELKERIAQRLGRYRCEFIEWTDKDANGALISGEIENDIKNRKRFPVSGTWQIKDIESDIFDLYHNGLPETIKPKHPTFAKFNEMYSVMRGQLTIGTGIPSHGKSNFTEWYALNLVKDYNMKMSMFTPEHSPMSLHQTTLIQKAIGRNFWSDRGGKPRINEADINRYVRWANERIYTTLPEKGEVPTWDWLLDKFKEQMFAFGVDIFLIDAFNKVLLPRGVNKIDAINEVLTKLTSFAQVNNVVVFLIAHPTKMKKDDAGVYNTPSLYDVSGSADFRNQTHNGFAIHRYFEDENGSGYTKFINLKTKFQFQGNIGAESAFNYDVDNSRYYGHDCPRHDIDLTLEDIGDTIQPNLEFESSAKEIIHQKKIDNGDYDIIEDDDLPF